MHVHVHPYLAGPSLACYNADTKAHTRTHAQREREGRGRGRGGERELEREKERERRTYTHTHNLLESQMNFGGPWVGEEVRCVALETARSQDWESTPRC